eukprot:scaffold83127_cov51-Phaeocystis_antarctica.AAC.1
MLSGRYGICAGSGSGQQARLDLQRDLAAVFLGAVGARLVRKRSEGRRRWGLRWARRPQRRRWAGRRWWW